MSKGDAFENDLLRLIFNAVAIANIADNAAASPDTNFFISLHTADPGEAGDQTTNETSYTGYVRIAIIRTSAGWTVSTNQAVNASTVTFGLCTAGTPTLTHFAVGRLLSGAGKLLYSGALTAPLAVTNGISPSFAPGALVITED